jgi:hypothetical protein
MILLMIAIAWLFGMLAVLSLCSLAKSSETAMLRQHEVRRQATRRREEIGSEARAVMGMANDPAEGLVWKN